MRLSAENLVVMRGGRRVIDGLSFSLGRGEALVLKGPNGSGKTTLIRAIAGFLGCAEGRIELEGGENDRSLAEQCHYIGHTNGIKANLTVAENALFWARYLGGEADGGERAQQALERFRIASLAAIPAGYLSAGQKRRLGLARLALAPRPIWLLDEPTVSLDTTSAAILATAVNEHVASGGLCLAATHLPLGLQDARELDLGAGGTFA